MEDLSILITSGEVRWRGTAGAPLSNAAGRALRAQAEAAGVLDLVEAHIADGVTVAAGAGFVAYPRAARGSVAAATWQAIRGLAPKLQEIREIANHVGGTSWDAPLRALMETCEQIAHHGTTSRLTAANQVSVLLRTSQADALVAKCNERSGADVQIFLGGSLGVFIDEVSASLASIQSGLAFAGQVMTPEKTIAEARADTAIAAMQQELSKQLATSRHSSAEIELIKKEAAAVMVAVRGAAGASAARDSETSFQATADRHHNRADAWAALAALIMAIAAGVSFWFLGTASDVSSTYTWQMVLSAVAPRLLLVSILLSSGFWAARMSGLHRRAEIADRHRVNALVNYALLIGAAHGDPSARTAVLTALTATVFGQATVADGPAPEVPAAAIASRILAAASPH